MEDEDLNPRELDCLINAADKLYMQFARSCGLSTCAYWMMYDIERAGGSVPVKEICDTWSYSKQTINSALKSLEGRGLIALEYCEGSRRNKDARFTEAGCAFSEANIVPAMEAEQRAFDSLSLMQRKRLIQLLRSYRRAIDVEFDSMQRERTQPAAPE